MKFIHFADVHFDMPMVALKENRDWIKKRRMEQKKAFRDVIESAKEEKVDALLIAGDLFEQKFVEESTLEYIISNLELIPDIPVFIAPGNHDPYLKNSPYDEAIWPDNVTIFQSEYGMISLEEADIYGVGFEDYEMDSDVIANIEIENPDKVNILVTHGTLNGANHKYHDVKEKDLKKFDYVALGHIHEKKVDDSRIIYPGSLLSCGFDEPGEHGFVMGEITKEKCEISFQKLDYTEFQKIVCDISSYGTFHDVIQKLNLGNAFYEIQLEGTRNFDTNELIEALKEQNKKICKIKDHTKVAYDFQAIQKEDNLKGVFTRKMMEKMEHMTPEEKEESYRVMDLIYQWMK